MASGRGAEPTYLGAEGTTHRVLREVSNCLILLPYRHSAGSLPLDVSDSEYLQDEAGCQIWSTGLSPHLLDVSLCFFSQLKHFWHVNSWPGWWMCGGGVQECCVTFPESPLLMYPLSLLIAKRSSPSLRAGGSQWDAVDKGFGVSKNGAT